MIRFWLCFQCFFVFCFFGNPLVSGLVLECEDLKMQATSFLAFMTMLRYFIPRRLAEMQEHDTLMFCQRQDIGTSKHTYHSFWWESQIIQSMFQLHLCNKLPPNLVAQDNHFLCSQWSKSSDTERAACLCSSVWGCSWKTLRFRAGIIWRLIHPHVFEWVMLPDALAGPAG